LFTTILSLSKLAGLSVEERAICDGLLAKILPKIGPSERAAFAETVSAADRPNPALITALAKADPDIAKPLVFHKGLTTNDLGDLIRKGPSDLQAAIATRKHLKAETIDTLLDEANPAALVGLVKNTTAQFTQANFSRAKDKAADHPPLQAAVLSRTDLSPVVAHDMFWDTHPVLRPLVFQKHSIDPGNIERVIADAVEDGLFDCDPADLLRMFNLATSGKGRVRVDKLVSVIEDRQLKDFMQLLAALTGAAPSIVSRMVQDTSGESLAVACRALDGDRSEFTRMFLEVSFLNSGEAKPLSAIEKAGRVFDHVDPERARSAIGIWNISQQMVKQTPQGVATQDPAPSAQPADDVFEI
ncbi:MAG: DUF2336 domain-containing protein, partial [Pseudomonadota bacterium]